MDPHSVNAGRRTLAAPLVFVLVAALAALIVGGPPHTAAPADTAALVRTAAAPAAFVHPGILVGRDRLDAVKGRIAANAEPWASAFTRMRNSRFARTTYTPAPVAVIDCTA